MNLSELDRGKNELRLLRHNEIKAAVSYIATQGNLISSVVPPILVIVGIAGNILSLIVLRWMKLKKSSLVFYMRVFLVMSCVVLLLFPGLEWLMAMLSVTPFIDRSEALCRIWTFVSNVVLYSPIWISVAMIADQCLSMWHPKLALSVCTTFSAKLIATMIFIGLIAISVHSLWTYEIGLKTKRCILIPLKGDYHNIVWPWITLILLVSCPLILILICNICVIIGLCQRQSPSSNIANNKTMSELRICTLILTCYIFLTSAPTTILTVLAIQMPPNWMVQTAERLIAFKMADLVFQMLTMSYYAIVLPILLSFSSQFRRAILTRKICQKCTHRDGENGHNAKPTGVEQHRNKNHGIQVDDLQNSENQTFLTIRSPVASVQDTLL